jgi:hypothetical protein
MIVEHMPHRVGGSSPADYKNSCRNVEDSEMGYIRVSGILEFLFFYSKDKITWKYPW